MYAFERRSRIQRGLLGQPEKSRTLYDKKGTEPFSTTKRRMTKGLEKTGRDAARILRTLGIRADKRCETGLR